MRVRLAAVAGAAVLLSGATGAVAWAVVDQGTPSPTDTGNDLPIDDNRQSMSCRGCASSPRSAGPGPSTSGRRGEPEPGDHHTVTTSSPTTDDRGTATPSSSTTDDRGKTVSGTPGQTSGGGNGRNASAESDGSSLRSGGSG